jgi:hypothetical protein
VDAQPWTKYGSSFRLVRTDSLGQIMEITLGWRGRPTLDIAWKFRKVGEDAQPFTKYAKKQVRTHNLLQSMEVPLGW